MVQFNGLKPLSSKIIVAVISAVLILVGTSYAGGEAGVSLAKAILLIALGVILFIEIGAKRMFDEVSDLKRLGYVQYISLFIGSVAIIGGLLALPLVNVVTPDWITTLSDVVVTGGAAMVLVEAFA